MPQKHPEIDLQWIPEAHFFDFADPPHRRIDDYPFGGGVGMVLKPEPVFRAFDEVMDELPKKCV